MDVIERAALSFGLSITVTPLIGLALTTHHGRIRLTPIIISISAFTRIMVLIAFIRRMRVPEGEKFYLNFDGFFSSVRGMFKGESTNKILSFILLFIDNSCNWNNFLYSYQTKRGETFTEFYILGPGGNASDYPTNLTLDRMLRFIIDIVYPEYKTVNYHLVVTSDDAVLVIRILH